MPQKAFRISAINLQTDKQEWFGPFPGDLHITYENINSVSDRDGPETVFIWESCDAPQDELDGDAWGWVGREGDFIPDGWRRCYRNPPNELGYSYGQAIGPFWSDLSFYFGTVPDDYAWPERWNAPPPVVADFPTNPMQKGDYDDRGGYEYYNEQEPNR